MTLKEQSIEKLLNDKLRFCPGGICPNCERNIVEGIIITEDMEVITSCKFCNYSFID